MIYQGIAISPGVAVAPVCRYVPAQMTVTQQRAEDAAQELQAYEAALAAAAAALEAAYETMKAASGENAAIFEAHLEILRDVAMDEEIRDAIACGDTAAWAVECVYSQYADLISALDDERMRERAADLRDVKKRLLDTLLGGGGTTLADLKEPSIVVAQELMPSDTAALDPKMVRAIVTEAGGATSHCAILARSLGIPAVSGIAALLDACRSGELAAVDAAAGTVEFSPDEASLTQYAEKERAFLAQKSLTAQYLTRTPFLSGGARVLTCLNIGSSTDTALQYAEHSDGVGLFRTEFLYMQSEALPDEQAQYEAYAAVADRFGDRQVILRTLDIGGDKTLAALPLPQEQNPFLGERALRLCFARPELLKTQLRAILRAAVHGNLAVMFPMVASLDDLRRAKALLAEAAEELRQAGIPHREDLPVGIMIEIPSIALIADAAAREVDFASVGTNDLCQYLLAADRMNPAVAPYYQSFHPAVFRLLDGAARAFTAAGKTLSVCGEMGGDPAAVLGLLSLGIRKFSMNASSLAAVKRAVLLTDEASLPDLRERLLACTDAQSAEALLRAQLENLKEE